MHDSEETRKEIDGDDFVAARSRRGLVPDQDSISMPLQPSGSQRRHAGSHGLIMQICHAKYEIHAFAYQDGHPGRFLNNLDSRSIIGFGPIRRSSLAILIYFASSSLKDLFVLAYVIKFISMAWISMPPAGCLMSGMLSVWALVS